MNNMFYLNGATLFLSLGLQFSVPEKY